MPKPNALTYPLSQTAIIFLGHLNIKMLTTSILLPLDVMYGRTRRKRCAVQAAAEFCLGLVRS